MRFVSQPLCSKVRNGRALSVNSDEGEVPGEADMWRWLFELAHHHVLGGALLESGEGGEEEEETMTATRKTVEGTLSFFVFDFLGGRQVALTS